MCMRRNSQYLLLNVNQDPQEKNTPPLPLFMAKYEPIMGPRSKRLSGGPFRMCRVMVPDVVGCQSQYIETQVEMPSRWTDEPSML